MRLTLTNNEETTAITVGLAGGQANAGGRTGLYEIMPGESVPVEIDPDTTITFAIRTVEPTKDVETPAE